METEQVEEFMEGFHLPDLEAAHICATRASGRNSVPAIPRVSGRNSVPAIPYFKAHKIAVDPEGKGNRYGK